MSDPIELPDPALAPSVFRAAQCWPIRHATTGPKRTCCILTALYAAHRSIPEAPFPDSRVRMGRELGLDPWFVSGLIIGWDGYDAPIMADARRVDWTQWRRGQQYGAAAWQACEAARICTIPGQTGDEA